MDEAALCPVCLDPLTAPMQVPRCPGGCAVAFHLSCLREWDRRYPATCPTCRAPTHPLVVPCELHVAVQRRQRPSSLPLCLALGVGVLLIWAAAVARA